MELDQVQQLRQNIDRVLERKTKRAIKAGRNPKDITLVAVTKQKSAALIKTLSEFGISDIGESYLNEALFKIDLLRDFNLRWHMIGSIQKGKEKKVALNFTEVHSVENPKSAILLNKYAQSAGKTLPVYLEMNVSGEDSKHGWAAWKEGEWAQLAPEIEQVAALPNLSVKGLMTMAPYSNDPETSRPYFRRLKELREYLARSIQGFQGSGLSMGMSGDFEIAIEEGATVLRIGSALVGPR